MKVSKWAKWSCQTHRSQLIILWLGQGFVKFFVVTDHNEEARCYAAIGSGAFVAASTLMAREYEVIYPLEEAVYYVYEAKRSSERVPGVGKDTQMHIIEFDPNIGKAIFYDLSPREFDQLNLQYEECGPKPLKRSDHGEAVLNLSFIQNRLFLFGVRSIEPSFHPKVHIPHPVVY